MATAKNKSKVTRTRKSATPKRARGKLAPGASARGLDAADVIIAMDSAEIADVVALIKNAGGALIGAYRDPLGGRPLVLASLPLSVVQPTPFQRDLSPTHAKRLAVKYRRNRGLFGSADRRARRRWPLVDAQWPSPIGCREGSGAQADHCADLPR